MLEETVVLYNYIGEIDDIASYQKTVLKHCYCVMSKGVSLNSMGHAPRNSGRLYIFDEKTLAQSEDGRTRSYLPYDQWIYTNDKSGFWTIGDCGKDYFQKVGTDEKLKISGFSRKMTGRKTMWHFEVDGV